MTKEPIVLNPEVAEEEGETFAVEVNMGREDVTKIISVVMASASSQEHATQMVVDFLVGLFVMSNMLSDPLRASLYDLVSHALRTPEGIQDVNVMEKHINGVAADMVKEQQTVH